MTEELPQQEPKIEQLDPKEEVKKELQTAILRLEGLVDEGGVRVSIDQLEYAIKEAQSAAIRARNLLEK